LAGEKYCLAFQSIHGIDIVCLRYFNVYGPKQTVTSEGSVIPEFLRRIGENKPLRIHGGGRQLRNFIYVADAVEATILAAEVKKASARVVDVGTGKPTSILASANQLMRLCGYRRARKVPTKPRPGDALRSQADTSRAKAILGFKAKTRLEDGLKSLSRGSSIAG
jgi:UDP-glucose 4-epimerase